jgi:hypothetical protein
MAEVTETTFICPACGEAELPLPVGMNPNETPYIQLAELHDCKPAQTAQFIFGNAHTSGFGGVIRENTEDGGIRERWVPPRAVIAYHFYQDQNYLAREEAASACYPQPLFRNRTVIDGVENVFVAMTFLPHGDTLSPEMRAKGTALAQAMR